MRLKRKKMKEKTIQQKPLTNKTIKANLSSKPCQRQLKLHGGTQQNRFQYLELS